MADTFRQWNITLCWEEMKYQARQRHGGNLKAYY